jgi:hypothetical protein
MAIRYLAALELKHGIIIQHVGRGPEKRIFNAGVDGYREDGDRKIVYQV